MLKKTHEEKLHCYHCGLPTTQSDAYYADLNGDKRAFCCPACRVVAATIVESGLGSYYRHFSPSGIAAESSLVQEDFMSFDDPEWQGRYISIRERQGERLATVQLLLSGIHCAACVWLLEKYLSAMAAVSSVSVSLSEGVVTICWDSTKLPLSEICRAIASLGYEPHFYTPDRQQQLQQQESHQALRRLGVAGIGMMQVGMFAIALYAGALQGIDEVYRDYLRLVSLLVATPVVFYSARPFFTSAWRGIKTKSPGMDLPVALAIGLAYVASVKASMAGVGEVYFDSVVMFTFLLLAGRYFEMRARHRSGQLSSDLFSLLPATVTRVNQLGDSRQQEVVPLFKIQVGDFVVVRSGQIVPVDGVVVSGQSCINEAQLTGEFMPQQKVVGDEVVAGTTNENGVLTIRATAVGADLKLQTINALLAQAQSSKPRVAQLADRYASAFVIAVLLLSAATFTYWHWVDAGQYSSEAFWVALSVLVVSCPCALSLATPAAMAAATHYLRGKGLLVTNSQVWEKAAGITDVVCDKTGTLTRGELSISSVLPVGEWNADKCLVLAQSLELHSEHPIAKAFYDPEASLLIADKVVVHQGQGIEAKIGDHHYRIGRADYSQELCGGNISHPSIPGQWVLLSGDLGPLCWFQLQDRLREDAVEFVQGMKRLGLRLHLLSGDSRKVVEQIGGKLNIERRQSDASPEQKLRYVELLQQQGGRVLMLGDGLNDIPVLAAADISVAMANASNLAKTQADAICLSAQLMSVVELLGVAGRARIIIRQNLLWALAYNFTAIPLAAMALVPPYLAALGMSLSSLVVVVNALRLQKNGADRVRHVQPQSPAEVAGG